MIALGFFLVTSSAVAGYVFDQLGLLDDEGLVGAVATVSCLAGLCMGVALLIFGVTRWLWLVAP